MSAADYRGIEQKTYNRRRESLIVCRDTRIGAEKKRTPMTDFLRRTKENRKKARRNVRATIPYARIPPTAARGVGTRGREARGEKKINSYSYSVGSVFVIMGEVKKKRLKKFRVITTETT